jgi:SAM-dependent methyltransferase
MTAARPSDPLGHPFGVPRTPSDPPGHPFGVPRTPPDPPGHPFGVPRTPPGEGGSITFDRAAGYYDQSRGLPAGVDDQVADRIEAAVGPSARLLELGVGTGRIALPLHRRGRRLVGVDLSLPMLDRYRAKAAALGLPPPMVLRADATRLPFRDACVDAVLEVHVLHLVPAWRQALAEVRRVLAPGGVVLVGRGGGRHHGEGPGERVRRRFEELTRAAGGDPRRAVGVDSDALKVAALVALGGVAEELEPVAWEDQQTYAQALREMEGRVYSYQWRLSDEVWRTAVTRLRAEVQAAHPDLDAPRTSKHRFNLTAVRF